MRRMALEDPEGRRASSRGLIPKAKVKTVKMTCVIILGNPTPIPNTSFSVHPVLVAVHRLRPTPGNSAFSIFRTWTMDKMFLLVIGVLHFIPITAALICQSFCPFEFQTNTVNLKNLAVEYKEDLTLSKQKQIETLLMCFVVVKVYGLIPDSPTSQAVATFIQSLAPLNSAANPLIYCLFSADFGKCLRLPSCFTCCTSEESSSMSSSGQTNSSLLSSSISSSRSRPRPTMAISAATIAVQRF